MKKVAFSLVAIVTMGASAYADTSDKISGEVSAFSKKVTQDGQRDTGYTNSSVSINYQRSLTNEIKLNLGFIGNNVLNEKNNGDFGKSSAQLRVSNLAYENSDFGLSIGRQAIGHDWFGDYFEAAVATYNGIENTAIKVAYANKRNGGGNDGALSDFTNRDAGKATLIDGVYTINDTNKIQLYYFGGSKFFTAIGGKYSTSIQGVGLSARYVATNEDSRSGKENGSILNIDGTYTMDNFNFKAGYAQTGKKSGVGSLIVYGDSGNPFDENDQFFGIDTSTLYVGAGVTVSKINLSGLYGTTSYGSSDRSEFDIAISTKIIDNLELKASYADISDDAGDKSFTKLRVIYTF
ncbi:Opr family porin [Arcobacter sp.]|uniref:Opr family porin n=1 Tax=Arcobacter sp. TaxID=1872629 RepID=UPI003D118B25